MKARLLTASPLLLVLVLTSNGRAQFGPLPNVAPPDLSGLSNTLTTYTLHHYTVDVSQSTVRTQISSPPQDVLKPVRRTQLEFRAAPQAVIREYTVTERLRNKRSEIDAEANAIRALGVQLMWQGLTAIITIGDNQADEPVENTREELQGHIANFRQLVAQLREMSEADYAVAVRQPAEPAVDDENGCRQRSRDSHIVVPSFTGSTPNWDGR